MSFGGVWHIHGCAGPIDDEDAAAVVFVGLFDRLAVFAEDDVGFGGFLFGNF